MVSYLVRSICLALAYFAAGYLGLLMPAVGTAITLMWLPTGIAVAILFREGYRYWPAISAGAILVNLAFGQGWLEAAGITVGNTLGPLLTTWILHKLGFDHRFKRGRDILYLLLAAHLGMLLSATGGVSVLVLSGALSDRILTAWLCWWEGDAIGVVTTAPLMMVVSQAGFEEIRQRYREFIGWLFLTSVSVVGVFVLNDNVNGPALSIAFIPLPMIVWATMRFSTTGTALAVILVSLGASWGTSVKSGPFYRGDLIAQLMMLWSYLATAVTLGWLVAALHLTQVRAAGIQRVLEMGLDAASLGVLLTDKDRRITYANEGFLKLTGYAEAELLGEHSRRLQGAETDAAAIAKMESDLKQLGHFDGEILNYRKDGTPFWNALLIFTIRDSRGQPSGFLEVQRDATAKKAAEIALQQSELRLRTILHLEPECVKIVSSDGRLLEMNSAGLAMIEADSIDSVRGAFLEQLIDPRHLDAFRTMHLDVLAGAAGKCVFAITGLQGNRRWLESHAVPYRDPAGQVVGQLSVTRDITERREREIQQANELAMFELLATGASLDQVLQRIALNVEQLCPGMICSVQILDDQGLFLRHAATSRLPEAWLCTMNGIRIGPDAGSCGTAAWTRRLAIASDISTDPRWTALSRLALSCGLRACWSVPLISSRDRVLGTLAMYFSEPRSPSAAELAAIERSAYFAVLVIERHNLFTSLRDSQLRLETVLSHLPGMAYRCQNNADWTMVYCSSGAKLVTGYAPEELQNPAGLQFADLVHPDDRTWLWEKCQAALQERVACSNTYRIFDKSGQIQWVLDRASGVYEENGSLQYIDGFVQNITESRRIEEQVRASLREKDAMLKEIHHRVKNNLQIISSLLNLQADTIGDAAATTALRDSQKRVRSMALVHETLYRSGNLGRIDLSEYIDALCRHLFRSYGIDNEIIRLSLNVVQAPLDLERAIPFGLIVNELLSNSLKYAFPNGRSGEVRVDFQITRERYYVLTITDTGVGLPESFHWQQLRSLGLQLVQDLIQQLSGTLELIRTPGTEFRISFPLMDADHERE